MTYKEFFKLTWPVFILFLVFGLFAEINFLEVSGIAGKSVHASIFDPFSFFDQLDAIPSDFEGSEDGLQGATYMFTGAFNFVRIVLTYILNIAWQYLLACLVMLGYNKIKKK